MNTYLIIAIVILTLIGYVIAIFNDKKTVKHHNHHEIPPAILKHAVYEDNILVPETTETRKEQFKKAFVSYKTNNADKFKELSQPAERREMEMSEIEKRKREAFLMVDKEVEKKESRLGKLGPAIKNVIIKTGGTNDEN
jgi:hypothetical protein